MMRETMYFNADFKFIKKVSHICREVALCREARSGNRVYRRERGITVVRLFCASFIGRDVRATKLTRAVLEAETEATARRISQEVVEIPTQILDAIVEFVKNLKPIKAEGYIKIPPNKSTFKAGSTTALELVDQIRRPETREKLRGEERKAALARVKELDVELDTTQSDLRLATRRLARTANQTEQDATCFIGIFDAIIARAPRFMFPKLRAERRAGFVRRNRRLRTAEILQKAADQADRGVRKERDRIIASLREIEKIYPPLDEMYRTLLREMPDKEPKARLITISTHCGKTRGITIHEEMNSWSCVNMTTLTIPFLKAQAASGPSLRDRPVHISRKTGDEPLFAYSVDYSKATDPISVTTAKRILKAMAIRNSFPSWFQDSVDKFFRPHDVEYVVGGESKTVRSNCGCLMGQGPGWAVLSVINMFCGVFAGGAGTFRIMGDDLIGLFTEAEIKRFRQIVKLVGFVLNDSKTFKSLEYGVFCEKLLKVVKRGEYTHLVEVATERLGEFTATKVDGTRGLGVLEQLESLPLISQTARRRRDRVLTRLTRDLPSGPLKFGGSGKGTLDRDGFFCFLRHGRTKTASQRRLVGLKEMTRLLDEVPVGDGTVSEKDLTRKIHAFCHLSHLDVMGKKCTDLSLSQKEFRGQFRKARGSAKAALDRIREKPRRHLDTTPKKVSRAKRYLRYGNYARAARALFREERRFDASTFDHLVASTSFEIKQLSSYKIPANNPKRDPLDRVNERR
jgi:hypothetical protein